MSGPRLARWLFSAAGVALLGALAWLFGPALDFLEPPITRAALVAALLVAWAAANAGIDWRQRRRETALTAGITASADMAAETAALRQKLAEALAVLRKARGARGSVYEQPWYLLIGPPGAGKTTALINAGLHFPLAAEMGSATVAGVGGTRLCDWWFTDDAVLIDTAGRYTTQDSDQAVDRAGWEGFLDTLKRTRPRQPVNGVIVAIAISDILAATPEKLAAHATAIRRRVREVSDRLGLRVPVYAMLTKADLLAGFTEFFDDLDRESRGQVWGTTFATTQTEVGPVAQFTAGFTSLLTRLDDRLINRLQAERSPARRALIAGFPAQVATLEKPVSDFLQAAFGGSKLDPAPFLRGVYLTSGTQEGTPIDRLTGALSRMFGVDQRRAPSLRPEQGRSYFLSRLLRDVVFNEAMLVASSPQATRRRLLLRAAAFAGIATITLGASAALWQARTDGQRSINAATRKAADYERAEAALAARPPGLDPVSSADLPALLAMLDPSRNLSVADAGKATWTGLDLSQTEKTTAAGALAYSHALGRTLLPRLVWRLENQMRAGIDRPEFLYEAMRVYLMLGNLGPLDRGFVHAWMAIDWQSAYPGATFAEPRESLLRHLDAMLAEPLPQVPLDGDLVARARETFDRVPLAVRVYARIRDSAPARRLPSWKPRDPLGAAGSTIFVRASGKPLDDGIPGFYTPEGFHLVLLHSLGDVIKTVAAENWVQGQIVPFDTTGPAMEATEHDVVALYEADFARNWDAMLADLNILEMRSVPQAAQDLFILGSSQSPLRGLLASIARQLTLSVPPTGAAQPADDAGNRLRSLLGAQAAEPASALPGSAIDARYKPIRDLVGSGAGAPIDLVLKSLTDLQQLLAKTAAAAGTATPASGTDPALAIRAEAQRQPQPLARWLTSMSGAARK